MIIRQQIGRFVRLCMEGTKFNALHVFHRQMRQRVGGTPVSWKKNELFFKLGGTLRGETPVS